jgi:hypothetical protein
MPPAQKPITLTSSLPETRGPRRGREHARGVGVEVRRRRPKVLGAGIFQAIEGFVAIFDDGYYLVRPERSGRERGLHDVVWIHLVIGLIAIAVGLGLMTGNTLARIVGVIIAVISATLNLLFIGAYPVWSTIIIASTSS